MFCCVAQVINYKGEGKKTDFRRANAASTSKGPQNYYHTIFATQLLQREPNRKRKKNWQSSHVVCTACVKTISYRNRICPTHIKKPWPIGRSIRCSTCRRLTRVCAEGHAARTTKQPTTAKPTKKSKTKIATRVAACSPLFTTSGDIL
jgi:hypothetical protein